jgi:peptide deformylase
MLLKKRPKFCTIKYFDINGKSIEEDLQMKRTRIYLHEYDHLEGNDLYNDFIDEKSLTDLKDKDKLNSFLQNELKKGYVF